VAVWVPVTIKWLHMLWRKYYCQLSRLRPCSTTRANPNQEVLMKVLSTEWRLGMLSKRTIAQNTSTFARQMNTRCILLRTSSRVNLLYVRHRRCNRRSVVHLQELYERILLW
jgi:hypothetical protein